MDEISRSYNISTQLDVIVARQEAHNIANGFGLSKLDQVRLATAVSELARNIIVHATKGTCIIKGLLRDHEVTIQAVFEDDGPGIEDIDKALSEGYTTVKGSLGFGLSGAKRLVDHLHIESSRQSTKVTIQIRRQVKDAL